MSVCGSHCLQPQAAAVNQHLIYMSVPHHIQVIIIYTRLDRDQLTCSAVLVKNKRVDKLIKNVVV